MDVKVKANKKGRTMYAGQCLPGSIVTVDDVFYMATTVKFPPFTSFVNLCSLKTGNVIAFHEDTTVTVYNATDVIIG